MKKYLKFKEYKYYKMTDDKKINMLPIFVQIYAKNDMPTLTLRTSTCNNELMKTIIEAAFNDQPLIIMPQFRNKMTSIAKLIETGIIYRNDAGELIYTY